MAKRKYTGETGFIKLGVAKTSKQLRIEVNVKESRYIFGRWEYLVTPVTGSGEIWVQSISK